MEKDTVKQVLCALKGHNRDYLQVKMTRICFDCKMVMQHNRVCLSCKIYRWIDVSEELCEMCIEVSKNAVEIGKQLGVTAQEAAKAFGIFADKLSDTAEIAAEAGKKLRKAFLESQTSEGVDS